MRLTLDWDTANWRKIEKRLRLLRVIHPKKHIFFRKSANGNYHVKVHGACESFRENIQLRKWLCDDPKRLVKDIERRGEGLPFNVLFSKKGEKEAGKWTKWI